MSDLLVAEHPLKVIIAISGEATDPQGELVGLWRDCPELSVAVVADISSMLLEIGRTHFDCLVIEEPCSTGSVAESVALIHAMNHTLPLLVVGHEASRAAAVSAVREGAFDYLLRSELTEQSFLSTIRRAHRRAALEYHVVAASEASRVAASVLRERELQIRGFFDFAGAAMALLDPGGRMIRANAALRRLTGHELGEISELSAVSLVVEADQNAVALGLAQLLTRRVDVWKREVRITSRAGESVWLDMTLALICDEDGSVQGYTLHATDITRRKETEAELQRSERRFQELLAQAPIGIFETNQDGECRFVNQRWSEVTGQSYYEAIGVKWTASVHRDDLTPIAEEWASAVRNSREFAKEFRFQRADGSVVWVSGRASSMKDNLGRVVGYLGTISDITDRHTAEEQVRRTGALLRGVLDNAPYIVVVTSSDGVIRDFNRGAEKYLGYSSNEAIGQLAIELLHDPNELREMATRLSREFEQPVTVGMPALASANTSVHSVWTYVRKDGSRFPVELAVREMRDTGGRLYGYVAIGRDITERLRRNQELTEAKELAESASAAKADFLARMSHEIRTPMNSVLGMTEIALQTSLTREQRSYLELVQTSGRGLLRLINDILDFSRGEAHRLVLEEMPFDLRETIGQSLRGLSLQARKKGVELVLRVSEDSPTIVVGDSHRLQQILANLVGNAVKFTAEGEVVVDVECSGGEPGMTTTLYLQVSDTGPGVAVEEQAKIFQAFAQEDTGIARRYGGTGLGLAICSQLVELMDGEIWLESELGQGTCFHVTLALSCAEQPDSTIAELQQVMTPGAFVLVVESNEKSREQTRRFLENAGYAAIPAATPSDALLKIQLLVREHQRIAWAVLDLPTWDAQARRFVQELERINGPFGMICLSPINRSEEERWVENLVSLVKPVLASDLSGVLRETPQTMPVFSGTGESPLSQLDLRIRPLHILVAEDNATNRLVVSTMLERLGYTAEFVDNGQAALKRIQKQRFDLVLMDLEMPIMGGMEAVRSLRERETASGGRLPVIALTAQAMPGDREACLGAGMDGYLSKPLDLSSLLFAIERVATESSLREVPRSAVPAAAQSLAPGAADIDLTALRSRIGHDRTALTKLSELFEKDSTRLLAEISAQVQAEGASIRSGGAHTLKGMLFNVCAPGAGALAASVESATQNGNWSVARDHLTMLRNQVSAVLTALQNEAAGR